MMKPLRLFVSGAGVVGCGEVRAEPDASGDHGGSDAAVIDAEVADACVSVRVAKVAKSFCCPQRVTEELSNNGRAGRAPPAPAVGAGLAGLDTPRR